MGTQGNQKKKTGGQKPVVKLGDREQGLVTPFLDDIAQTQAAARQAQEAAAKAGEAADRATVRFSSLLSAMFKEEWNPPHTKFDVESMSIVIREE